MILLLSDNYFTMVEENFENGLSETLQIGIFYYILTLLHLYSIWTNGHAMNASSKQKNGFYVMY